MTYLVNAFSMQMLRQFPASLEVTEIEKLPDACEYVSAIGHADTAAVLGVPYNRVNVQLNIGDWVYVAQLQGGRLPEGATTLPDGFSFKFLKVVVK